MFKVTDAVREQLIGAIGFIGASGAGKTLGMLKVAKGFMQRKYPDLTDEEHWQKIGVIDTEHERAKIYAGTSSFGLNIGSFKHLDFPAPYTVDRLDAAIRFLKDEHGVEIIIIDSTSHFWEGEGGILDLQQKMGGNFQAWREVNPHYKNFISLVTGEKYRIDMLNGMRAKQHYEVSQNEVGKLKIEKMGLKPVQRDSLEYEFHIVFNIDMDHIATAMKDNSGIFSGLPQQLEAEAGEKIYDWLKTGKDVIAEEQIEKQELGKYIRTYLEDEVIGEYVSDLIEKVEERYGKLENLAVDRLHGFVETIRREREERVKIGEEVGEEIIETLEGKN